MRIEVEGIGIVTIESLDDLPMLLEVLDEQETPSPRVSVVSFRQPEKAIVRINPKDIDEDGNISKAEVEFVYGPEVTL